MPTIEFTDRDPTMRAQAATGVLVRAAAAANRAPSVFDSQPWRWRVAGNAAELRADRTGQPGAADPHGRLLTMSCGAALHYARTALAGAGVLATLERLPEPSDPDLLARVRVAGFVTPGPAAIRLQRAMVLRHTDHHPVADLAVSGAALRALGAAAQGEGARLYLLDASDAVTLARLTGQVGYVRCAILCADADTPAAWLAAGEALSAVLLTATLERLAVAPMTGVVEVPAARDLLRDPHGVGFPMLALGVGPRQRRLGGRPAPPYEHRDHPDSTR